MLSNDYKNCIYLVDGKFVDNKDQVRSIWHIFKKKGERLGIVWEDKDKDSASESEEEIDHELAEASCIVKSHEVAIVCTGDGLPYYFVKLSKGPFTTTECVKDDYGHYIPASTKVIEGNYYEIFKKTKVGDLYFLDTLKLAIILCFSVADICPESIDAEQMRPKKLKHCS